MKINVNVIISGRVQGVWYRVSTKQKAEQLGVTGWVKNRVDGCVEAVFEGEEKIIEDMIKWCYTGPPNAIVKDIKVKKQTLINNFDDFSIKY